MAFGRMLLIFSSGFAMALPQHAAAQGNPWHRSDASRPGVQQNGGAWPSPNRYRSSWSREPAARYSGRLHQGRQSTSRWRGGKTPAQNGSWSSSGRPSSYATDQNYNNGTGRQQAYGGPNGGQPARAGGYPPAGYIPSTPRHRRQGAQAALAFRSGQPGPAATRPAARFRDNRRIGRRAAAAANARPEPNQVQGRFVPSFAAGQFGPYRLSGPAQPTGDYPPLDGDPASLHARPMPRNGTMPMPALGSYDRAARAPLEARPQYDRRRQTWQQQNATGSNRPAFGSPHVNQQWRRASPGFTGPSTFGNPYGGLYGGGGLLGGGLYGGGGGIGLVPGMGLGTGLGGFPFGGRRLDIY